MAVKKEKVIVEKPVEKSNEELKSEIDQLKELVKSLLESNKVSAPKESVSIPVKEEITYADEYIEVPPNKRIKVISLYDGTLTLVTSEYGKGGKPYTFNKFGESHTIIYSDLEQILHYQHTFAEKGMFYICDKSVISNNGLQDAYINILTKENIEKIMEYDRKYMLELFSNASTEQRESIVSILCNKLASGEELDLNKIDSLSRVYGKNINDMAEEMKALQVSE